MTQTTARKDDTQAAAAGKAAVIRMQVRALRDQQRKAVRKTAKVQNYFAGPHCTFLPQVHPL